MNGKSCMVGPSGLGLGKKCQSFTDASLHLHHVSNDVNRARMARIDGQSLPRYPFGRACAHAIAEQEVSRRRGRKSSACASHECENIARTIDDDRAIKLGCAARISRKPGSSSNGVTTGPMIGIRGQALMMEAMLALGFSCPLVSSARTIKAAHRQCPNTDLGSSARQLVNG